MRGFFFVVEQPLQVIDYFLRPFVTNIHFIFRYDSLRVTLSSPVLRRPMGRSVAGFYGVLSARKYHGWIWVLQGMLCSSQGKGLFNEINMGFQVTHLSSLAC